MDEKSKLIARAMAQNAANIVGQKYAKKLAIKGVQKLAAKTGSKALGKIAGKAASTASKAATGVGIALDVADMILPMNEDFKAAGEIVGAAINPISAIIPTDFSSFGNAIRSIPVVHVGDRIGRALHIGGGYKADERKRRQRRRLIANQTEAAKQSVTDDMQSAINKNKFIGVARKEGQDEYLNNLPKEYKDTVKKHAENYDRRAIDKSDLSSDFDKKYVKGYLKSGQNINNMLSSYLDTDKVKDKYKGTLGENVSAADKEKLENTVRGKTLYNKDALLKNISMAAKYGKGRDDVRTWINDAIGKRNDTANELEDKLRSNEKKYGKFKRFGNLTTNRLYLGED
jgi:hypothetical protein